MAREGRPLPRRRPRRGSLERPISTRIYRAAWMLAAVPLLVAAFTVGRPQALPAPALPPAFDETTAVQFVTELARRYPDRSPGGVGASGAADWLAERLREYGVKAERRPFEAEVAGLGRVRLENLVAVTPGRSRETIVVMAHRDNVGGSPGANDNASGTAALLELARTAATTPHDHTIVFVSSDGGAFGGLGASEFARDPEALTRLVGPAASIVAVVNLDSLAAGTPRIEFAGDTPRSPSSTLLATADASVLAQTGAHAERPGALAQLVDLAFPFSLYEQAPFVARGVPAVTLTGGAARPARPHGDTTDALDPEQLAALGRSTQALLTSLDQAAEVARGTQSYVYFGSRFLRGWTIQFLLLAALVPFLAATVDLFARCRRRHVPLAPALRSLRSRLGIWLWAGLVFLLFDLLGFFPGGAPRPISPEVDAAQHWPVAALLAALALSAAGWLLAWPRLTPRRTVHREEELGGHLAAMLALGVVALAVAAINPFALLFVLPSLHAWLWLPHAAGRELAARLGLYALGFAGPLLLVGSFALRFELGLDALWYVPALVSVGYVPLSLVLVFLLWGTVATQVGALAFGRYAPYPDAAERPARGPIRSALRALVLRSRRSRRREDAAAEPVAEVYSLER